MTIEQFIKGMKTADNSGYTLKDLISKLALAIKDDTSIKYKVSNILDMDDSVLDALKVGDVVQKKTDDMEHCYIVTYKEEKHGICLTYVDASVVETVSYDYSTDHWVYNSKDVTPLKPEWAETAPRERAGIPTYDGFGKPKVIDAPDSLVSYLLGLSSFGVLQYTIPGQDLLGMTPLESHYFSDDFSAECTLGVSRDIIDKYDLIIFTVNNSFVITPLSQRNNGKRTALTCGSFIYDQNGNTSIARLRFVHENGTSPENDTLTVHFDEDFAGRIYGNIEPTAYIFGVKFIPKQLPLE